MTLSDIISSPSVQGVKYADGEQASFKSIYVQMNVIPLLLVYVDNVTSTMEQIVNTITDIQEKKISRVHMQQYIQKNRKHSLYRFVKQMMDAELLKRQLYILHEKTCNWSEFCVKLGDIFI